MSNNSIEALVSILTIFISIYAFGFGETILIIWMIYLFKQTKKTK